LISRLYAADDGGNRFCIGGLFFLFFFPVFFWDFFPVFWWKEGARKEGRKEERKKEKKKEVNFS
jgi:hypothetical protein